MALNSSDSQHTDIKFKFDFTSPRSFPYLDRSDRDHQTTDLKARLKTLEDPLDLLLLQKLSLFFKVKGGNPEALLKLYEECINTLGKAWEPFVGMLGSTLDEGVSACKYLMVGYIKGMKVNQVRDVQDRQTDDNEFYSRQEKLITKAFTDLTLLVKSNIPILVTSDAISNKSAGADLLSHAVPSSLNQFIWEDGKSYRSKIGTLTTNRDGSISIIISSAEFQVINTLRTIILEAKHWEYILNRDLDKLISYLQLNAEQFKEFNKKDNSKKVTILNDLATKVPAKENQWINSSYIIDSPRCTLPCKLELEFSFKIEGPLPTSNLMELIETICAMVLLDWERPLKLSKVSKPFLWHFICRHIFDHLKFNHRTGLVNKASQEVVLKGLSEGLCQEIAMTKQFVSGDRIWELTDNCDKFVTVDFCYRTEYSTLQTSKKHIFRKKGYKIMKAPSADARARLLDLETRLLYVKIADQSEFLKPLLYVKRDDSTKVHVSMAS